MRKVKSTSPLKNQAFALRKTKIVLTYPNRNIYGTLHLSLLYPLSGERHHLRNKEFRDKDGKRKKIVKYPTLEENQRKWKTILYRREQSSIKTSAVTMK